MSNTAGFTCFVLSSTIFQLNRHQCKGSTAMILFSRPLFLTCVIQLNSTLYEASVLPNRNHYSKTVLQRQCDITGAIFTHPPSDLVHPGPRVGNGDILTHT